MGVMVHGFCVYSNDNIYFRTTQNDRVARRIASLNDFSSGSNFFVSKFRSDFSVSTVFFLFCFGKEDERTPHAAAMLCEETYWYWVMPSANHPSLGLSCWIDSGHLRIRTIEADGLIAWNNSKQSIDSPVLAEGDWITSVNDHRDSMAMLAELSKNMVSILWVSRIKPPKDYRGGRRFL